MPNVEIALTNNGWGGDFSVDATGDLVLAIDAPNAPVATQQRVYRLIMTSPGQVNEETNEPISIPDDLFAFDYGGGLRLHTGQMITPQLFGQIEARIESALQSDDTIDPTVPPVLVITVVANNTVQIDLSCNAVDGSVITIPSFNLALSGS